MNKVDAGIQLLRQIGSRLWEKMPTAPLEPSATPIDVVIPIIAKDLDILPLCLQGVRQNVRQHVKDIYVVAPPDAAILDFCQRERLQFVDESTILHCSPRDIGLQITLADGHTVDRSGWLFQQLLKLSGNIGTCDYYLTIDADHILLQPHVFLTADETPVFYMSDECNTPYYAHMRRLMNTWFCAPFSYVDHKMLFSKRELARLRQRIEALHPGKSWTEAILATYDRSQTSGFSEFETYGSFVRRKVRRPWCHLKLAYSSLADYASLHRQYASQYHCVTFPCYLKSK